MGRDEFYSSRFFLIVAFDIRKVLVDHSTPISLCFGDSLKAAFLIPRDLVLRIKTLKDEFASGNYLRFFLPIEFKRNKCRFDRLGRKPRLKDNGGPQLPVHPRNAGDAPPNKGRVFKRPASPSGKLLVVRPRRHELCGADARKS